MDTQKIMVDRRQNSSQAGTLFFPALVFFFSLSGFIAWIVRYGDGNFESGVASTIGLMFGLLTLVSGIAFGATFHRNRLYDRRRIMKGSRR